MKIDVEDVASYVPDNEDAHRWVIACVANCAGIPGRALQAGIIADFMDLAKAVRAGAPTAEIIAKIESKVTPPGFTEVQATYFGSRGQA